MVLRGWLPFRCAVAFALTFLSAHVRGTVWDFETRGALVFSEDGKTYLVVDDDNGGQCGSISIDGGAWPYPIHKQGPIEPGTRQIECGGSGKIEFVIPQGVIYHFVYWGP